MEERWSSQIRLRRSESPPADRQSISLGTRYDLFLWFSWFLIALKYFFTLAVSRVTAWLKHRGWRRTLIGGEFEVSMVEVLCWALDSPPTRLEA
ncbi:hypothetical protein F2Q69_00051607 [Brassica cretica]|uniref:Uncharacterized protein n=1 Tax=Brassica cretica TaxID=69181 RepID=A0A8S9Q870_BRACR|nr:hypothetical protein F2Q69_00051607 [Brassica cretica]